MLDADGKFVVVGDELRVDGALNFEAQVSHDVTVRVTDSGGEIFEKLFTINVNDVNEAPTDIGLSAAAVDENMANGTVIGTLSATDPDTGETFTVSEVIDPDGKFAVVGDELRVDGPLDFENQGTHDVAVRVTDSGGLIHDKVFTISVNDVNEAPTVATSIDDVVANEDAADLVIDLMDVFADPDFADELTIFVSNNTNTDLVLGAVGGLNLTLEFGDQRGTAEITVRATDVGGEFVEDTFQVTVLSTQDQISGALDSINGLVDTGDLDANDADKLIGKLQKAHEDSYNGENDKGIQELAEFKDEVGKLVDNGDLAPSIAADLLAAADAMIESGGVSAPQSATLAVIGEVNNLIGAGDLDDEDGNKLIDELDKAITELDKLDVKQGIVKLETFIDDVNKLVDKDDLSPASGQQLIDAALAIIDGAIPLTVPQQETITLIGQVDALVSTGDLDDQDGDKLNQKLKDAWDEFGKLDLDKAVNKLGDFASEVQKLIDDGDLPTGLGQPLIDEANNIINNVV